MGVDDIGNGNIALTCLNYLCTGMEGIHHLSDLLKFIRGYQIGFVDDEGRAELDLLDQEALNILFPDFILMKQLFAGSKLLDQTGCVNNSHHVIQISV